MSVVRPARRDDLGHLAALHRTIWGGPWSAPESAERYIGRLFFEAPAADGDPGPLVWQDAAGRVTGCLGVLPGRMASRERALRVAIGHNFMVAPRARGSLAGVALLRTLLAGPQDLTLAQSPEPVARLWERLGGVRLASFSSRWTQPLSPSRYAATKLAPGPWPVPGPWLRRSWALLDRLVVRRARVPGPLPCLEGRTAPLTLSAMVTGVRDHVQAHAVGPDYDAAQLAWVLGVLAGKTAYGTLHQAMVLGPRDEPVGWYIYFAGRRGIGEVVQIAAGPEGLHTVVDHLVDDARRRGMMAISGQLEPRLLPVLSRALTLLHPPDTWVLAHSRHPDVLEALVRGDAFLSRLDGEWWVN
jgi:hypothetical protein